jgi:hypothetical protein
MATQSPERSSALQHTDQIRDKLGELRDLARSQIDQVGDPKAKALLETTAEVVQGLLTTDEDVAVGQEAAWQ